MQLARRGDFNLPIDADEPDCTACSDPDLDEPPVERLSTFSWLDEEAIKCPEHTHRYAVQLTWPW